MKSNEELKEEFIEKLKWDSGNDSEMQLYFDMLHRCYGENVPEDAWDYPSASIFSPGKVGDSDYHVKLGYYEWDNTVSREPFYCPAVLAQKKSQKSNRETFTHIDAVRTNRTTFGKALKAYLELCVFLLDHDKPITNYTRFFKNEWKVDPSVDFTPLYPKVNGTGPTRYATWTRELNPEIFYNSELGSVVDVVSHSLIKKNLKSDALVDWARLQAILTGVAINLHCEGVKDVRFDYNVVTRNLPNQITDFEWDDGIFEIEEDWITSVDTMKNLTQIFKRAEKLKPTSFEDEHIVIKESEAIIINEVESFSLTSNLISNFEIEDVDLVSYFKDFDDTMEIEDPTYVPKMKNYEKPVGRIFGNYLLDLVDVIVRLGLNVNYTPADYHKIKIQKLSKKVDDEILLHVINKPILTAIQHLAKYRNREDGTAYSRLCRYYSILKIPKNLWSKRDLDTIIRGCYVDTRCRKQAAKMVMNAIGEQCSFRIKNGTLDRGVFEVMRKTGDIYAGMSMFIKNRKAYWAKHYSIKARETKEPKDKILFQQVSAMFKHVQVHIGAEVGFNNDGLCEEMYKTAKRYLEKRKTYEPNRKQKLEWKPKKKKIEDPDDIPTWNQKHYPQYAHSLDDGIGWEIKADLCIRETYERAKALNTDVEHLFHKIVEYDPKHEVPDVEEFVRDEVFLPDKSVVKEDDRDMMDMFGGDLFEDDDLDDDDPLKDISGGKAGLTIPQVMDTFTIKNRDSVMKDLYNAYPEPIKEEDIEEIKKYALERDALHSKISDGTIDFADIDFGDEDSF